MSTLEITDLTVSYAAANAGDHNVPIAVTVPAELVDLNPDYYILHFLTADYQSISSSNLTAVDGVVSFALTDELTVAGLLKMRIGAYDMTGLELTSAKHSDVCTLIIGNGIPDGITGNTEAQGLMAELQTALLKVTKYIVDDLTALNALTGMSDGDQAIVRKITQKSDLNFDTSLGDNPFCVPRFLPQLYFNPIILTPNWAELGVSSTVLSCELSFARNDVENINPIYKYLLSYFPAEVFGLEVVILFDDYAKYVYSFADDVDLRVVAGWNKALMYNEDDEPITYEAVSAPPAIKNAVSCTFDVSANGTAAQKYFEDILNTEPFVYRSYIRDGEEWILI